MKLSDQVCSLELAKKLEKLKIKQDSLWYWSDYESDDLNDYLLVSRHYKLICGDVVKSYFISAPTVAELGEMLPDIYGSYKVNSIWCEFEDGVNNFACCYYPEDEEDGISDIFAGTEADARAKMLIYLIENNLIKVKEL